MANLLMCFFRFGQIELKSSALHQAHVYLTILSKSELSFDSTMKTSKQRTKEVHVRIKLLSQILNGTNHYN